MATKLHYFDLMARAEPVRMMLTRAGVEFEDCRYTGEAWVAFKASGVLEFGQMPMLEIDGAKLTQSKAICDYVG